MGEKEEGEREGYGEREEKGRGMRREEKGEGERGGDGESDEKGMWDEKGMGDEKRVGRMRGDGEGMFKMEKNNEKVLRNVSRFPLTKSSPHPYIDPKTQGLRIGEEGRKWGMGKVWGREGLKNCHFLIHQPSPPLPSPAQRPLLPPSSVIIYRETQSGPGSGLCFA